VAKGKFERWIAGDGLLLLEAWARDGLTDEQIAENVGVTRSTLYAWKNRFKDISNALKKGKEIADIQVENALYKRAVGYRTTEVTQELKRNVGTGFYELVTTKKVEKDVPPDVTAQIYWLKNRRPDKWRDKQQIDIGKAEDTGVIELPRRLEDA
jgi:hypothetical protein